MKKINTCMKINDLYENNSEYPFEWNTKTIIWSDGDYFIATSDPERNTYLTLWTDENKQIGKLSFDLVKIDDRYGDEYKGQWYKINTVDVQKNYRGKSLGKQLYKTGLEWMPENINGIYSYLPDVVAKKVPLIHNSLNAENIDSDHVFITKDDR